MKSFRSSLLLLVLAAGLSLYIYFDERGPVADAGATVLLRTDPGSVASIALAASGGTEVDLTRSGGSWKVSSGKVHDAPADADTVKTLLDAVQLVQSQSPVDNPTDLKTYGLDHPSSTITVDGTALSFGNRPSFDAGQIYVKCGDTVALVSSNLADNAAKDANYWREKKILDFTPDDVKQLTLTSPAGAVTLARDDDKWKVTAPLQAPADGDTVSSFLATLSTEQNSGWLDENPVSLAKWGLDHPLATVNVDGTTLRIGKKQGNSYAAQNSQSSTVFSIGSSLYDLINRPLPVWRDKHVAHLDMDSVQGIDLTLKGQNVKLTKSGQKWAVAGSAAPSSIADTTTETALQLLSELNAWTATSLIDHTTASAGFGLDHPEMAVNLEGGGDLHLKISRERGQIYADNGSGTIFVLPSDRVDNEESDLNSLLPSAPAGKSGH